MLIDPVSGRPLNPDAPPEFLLDNSRLTDEYELLQAQQLSLAAVVGIMYGAGDRRYRA
jgi:hypothetical protein